jgi:uncharacterized coiled-coil DUF342 family protein
MAIQAGLRLIEDLLKKIDELEKESKPLRDERDLLNTEAKKSAQKRDELNTQIRTLYTRALEFKAKRDELNRKVKELKTKRDELRKQLEGKPKESSKPEMRSGRSAPYSSSQSEKTLKRRIADLEWTVQTTSLSVKAERRLIAQVKDLEGQLEALHQQENAKRQRTSVDSESEAISQKIREFHEQLSKLAKESQDYHEQMDESLQKAQQLHTEADECHMTYVNSRQKADAAHQKLLGIIAGIREAERQINQYDETIRRDQLWRLLEAREETTKKANTKLKKGEKLSFDEFKLLVEKGMV